MKEYLTEEQKLEVENLKKKKISELSPEEVESRINTLAFVSSFDVVINYLLYVVDIEYSLSELAEDNLAAKNFLADERFNKFRDGVRKHVDELYFDEINEINSNK